MFFPTHLETAASGLEKRPPVTQKTGHFDLAVPLLGDSYWYLSVVFEVGWINLARATAIQPPTLAQRSVFLLNIVSVVSYPASRTWRNLSCFIIWDVQWVHSTRKFKKHSNTLKKIWKHKCSCFWCYKKKERHLFHCSWVLKCSGRRAGFQLSPPCPSVFQEQLHVPVYHPTPSQARLATQLTEEEQVRIAQRIGLIQHLPKGVYDPGRDGSEKKIRE